MSVRGNLARALKPADTSELDAAFEEARKAQHAVKVRSRALRMDVACGNPADLILRLTSNVANHAGAFLRHAFSKGLYEPLGAGIRDALHALEQIE